MTKSKRVFALLLAVIVAVEVVSYRRNAQALAIEASVVAAVAAVLTACGVTYWASNQADAVSYLASQLDDYLDETGYEDYEAWLGLSPTARFFDVVSGGVISIGSAVANKILAFVDWLVDDQSISSGGAPVGNLAMPNGWVQQYSGADFYGTFDAFLPDGVANVLTVSLSGAKNTEEPGADPSYMMLRIPCLANSNVTVRVVDSTANLNLYAGMALSEGDLPSTFYGLGQNVSTSLSVGNVDFVYLWIKRNYYNINWGNGVTGTAHLSLNFGVDIQQEWSAKITPSDLVYVPPALGETEQLIITTNAPVSALDSKEESEQAILDTIVSEDGLESTSSSQSGALEGWGWLQFAISGIEDTLDGISEALRPQYGEIDDYQLDLTTVFPFCIPWDIYRGLYLLDAEPLTPSVRWDMPLPSALGGGYYHWEIDLSDFDGVAALLRHMELLAFAIGLMIETKRLIKW